MNRSLRSVIPRILDVLWRRWVLLVSPVLVMVPIGVIAAIFMPGGYSARSLIALQEKSLNPLAATDSMQPSEDKLSLMLKSARALLASDYVLGQAVDAAENPQNPSTRALKILDLRRRLTLDLLGKDFLELRLAGGHRQGLGHELDLVMASFLEALMWQSGLPVGEFLLRKRKEDLRNAERSHAALQARLAALAPSPPNAVNYEEVKRRKRQIEEKIASLSNQIAASTGGGAEEQTKRLIDDREALTRELRQLDDIQTSSEERASLESQLKVSSDALAALRASVEADQKRFAGISNTAGNVINAPERLIIVDPPEDPVVRTIPRGVYLLAGLFGGLVLGVALTTILELLDTTVRYAEQLSLATGIPIIARLPQLVNEPDEARTLATSIEQESIAKLRPKTHLNIAHPAFIIMAAFIAVLCAIAPVQ